MAMLPTGSMGETQDIDSTTKSMGVVEYRNPPQQQNGLDCGIMALKYIVFGSGHGVDEPDPERCSIYRGSYSGQLFDFGKKCYRP